MTTEEQLVRIHRQVAQVVGAISTAISVRRLTVSQSEHWARTLREAATRLEAIGGQDED